MSDDVTDIAPLMIIAARLRCEGKTWYEVADAVGRSFETVSDWLRKRPDDWYPALQQAINEAMPETEREALHLLRSGLRQKNKKGQWVYTDEGRKSAAALLRHIRECRAKSIEIGGLGGGLQIVITPAKAPEEASE